MKLALQQPVIITSGGGRQIHTEPGTIVKIGRVWVDIQPDNRGVVRRFRMDTQSDGSGIGYGTHFYTLDQWAEHQRQKAASEFLRDQGITIESRSPWHRRATELADLIRASIQS